MKTHVNYLSNGPCSIYFVSLKQSNHYQNEIKAYLKDATFNVDVFLLVLRKVFNRYLWPCISRALSADLIYF